MGLAELWAVMESCIQRGSRGSRPKFSTEIEKEEKE